MGRSVEQHHAVEVMGFQMGEDDLKDLWEVKWGGVIWVGHVCFLLS